MNVPREIESRLRRVSSRQNAVVKDLRKALSQGEPTAEGYIAVEGVRMIEEAIRSGLRFQAVFFSEAGSTHATRLLPQIGSQVEILLLPDEVFISAVSTESPQGVAALVKLRPHKFEDLMEAGRGQLSEESLLVGVAGIQDPGNLGTIIRSAEAFGARAVLLGEKTVSHFNSKTVRGSAGSLFRQPLLRVKLNESITTLKQHGVRVLTTSSHKGKPLHEADFTGAVMVVVGNEGAGVPAEILSLADEVVMIPHSPRVESLNAGIAASILLYEAARQRSKHLTTDEHG
ncbi:MAG TPA: RNA methyltransferase [Candidatus Angelobacter sp.]|jgi:TrmH family RNA methyltransferase|nr:RNA methyltransferase [Candidatus Angelobacter sp.]